MPYFKTAACQYFAMTCSHVNAQLWGNASCWWHETIEATALLRCLVCLFPCILTICMMNQQGVNVTHWLHDEAKQKGCVLGILTDPNKQSPTRTIFWLTKSVHFFNAIFVCLSYILYLWPFVWIRRFRAVLHFSACYDKIMTEVLAPKKQLNNIVTQDIQ